MGNSKLSRWERDVQSKVTLLTADLLVATNFLEYSQENLDLIQELKNKLSIIKWHNSSSLPGGFSTSMTTSETAIINLEKHIQKVHDSHNNITEEAKIETIEIWKNKNIDLNKHLDLSLTPASDLELDISWWTKVVSIKNKDWNIIANRNWNIWIGKPLNISWNNLNIDLSSTWILPIGISIDQYPLSVEIELYSKDSSSGTHRARIQTLPKIKFNIKEAIDTTRVLWDSFTGTETYKQALDSRLSGFHRVHAENIIKEYIWKRIDESGGSLSDTQKNILIDHLYSDSAFLNGDTNNGYDITNFQSNMPDFIAKESVGGDSWYKNDLRKLLINPKEFNTKSKEVFLSKLKDKKNDNTFILRDEIINQQVNNFIQEQANNSIWNITNNALPVLLSDFSAKNNIAIRHKNEHKRWFRWWKKMIWIFKWKKKRKLTDISTNNYFSFFSGSNYNISDNIEIAEKKVNQDIKLDINSWNNISASIKISWDEEANFEFAGASSIYELITGILWNTDVWPITKLYLTFNIYKQFFKKMQELFGKEEIIIWGNEYKINSKDKLKVQINWNTVFDEEQFRKLESADDLQRLTKNLAENFNTIMNHNNSNYIKWMTTKKQNKFKIWEERFLRILRKRRNTDFNFKTEVEWVDISYENKKFTVNYEGEEIKANKIETILSHKILEWKQIQIMKAIYKALLSNIVDDPKAQTLLKKKSGIGFVVEHWWVEYVISTQWGTMKFGKIPLGFPRTNIDKKKWILKWGMFTIIPDNKILTNPELASALINEIKKYRRMWIKWVDYGK